jgi:hypothetical protein
MKTYYKVQEPSLFPDKEIWLDISDTFTENEEKAFELFAYVQSQDRKVRLVKVTEEVIRAVDAQAEGV